MGKQCWHVHLGPEQFRLVTLTPLEAVQQTACAEVRHEVMQKDSCQLSLSTSTVSIGCCIGRWSTTTGKDGVSDL